MDTPRQKIRKRWPKPAQILDRERRAKLRAHFIRYCPNPLKPADTRFLVHEELALIERMRAGDVWHKLWDLLNEMAGSGHEIDRRPRRQAYLVMVTRLLREKKLVRHARSNSIALAEWLREPASQLLI